jgi:uroporphyrinogen-III synthase
MPFAFFILDIFSDTHDNMNQAVHVMLIISALSLFTHSFLLLILADNAFDWVVITSPEAGSVFLEAWR